MAKWLKILIGIIIALIIAVVILISFAPRVKSLRYKVVSFINREEVEGESKAHPKPKSLGGVLELDLSDDTLSSTGITEETPANTSINNRLILSGQDYMNRILQIRKPINEQAEEINKKMRYSKIFSQDEVIMLINQALINIDQGLADFKNIPIDSKFQEVNVKNIQSLALLSEAIKNLQKFYQEKDEAAFQMYGLKLEESNDLVRGLEIPD